jgi:hypothetical protein
MSTASKSGEIVLPTDPNFYTTEEIAEFAKSIGLGFDNADGASFEIVEKTFRLTLAQNAQTDANRHTRTKPEIIDINL